MISHDYRCIFIHIPRCAGTSVETWLCGRDWWDVAPSEKHMIASQARQVYADWWDEYFKFSVVRNPYSRSRSLLKFSDHFGLRKVVGAPIDFSGYMSLFGPQPVVEHDYRFATREQLLNERHRQGCIYGNILDENIDFVGKFEDLRNDMEFLRERLGIPQTFNIHVEQSTADGHETFTKEDYSWIQHAYASDFQAFNYPLTPIG